MEMDRPEIFSVACIELYTRLWLALERLDNLENGDTATLDNGLVVLRLEIVLLIDVCDSPRRLPRLSRAQRLELRSVLNAVLQCLSAPLHDGYGPRWEAQNRLLDAVRAQYFRFSQLLRIVPAHPRSEDARSARVDSSATLECVEA